MSFYTCFHWLKTLTLFVNERNLKIDVVLATLPEHLGSVPVLNGVSVARSLLFCVMFCRSLFVLSVLLLLVIFVVVVPFRLTASDYPFGIFKPLVNLFTSRIYMNNLRLGVKLSKTN